MSNDPGFSQLSAEWQAQIEEICEQFELAWQSAPPVPQLEQFERDWPNPQRSILRNELLTIESAYRANLQKQSNDQTMSVASPSKSSSIAEKQSSGKKSDLTQIDLNPQRQTDAGNQQKSPPRMIGHYRLIQKLGEGGMGEVWLTEQQHPVKRQVALKLIKAGVGSREVIARFEAERQALALMDHPNVARIIDAGTTDDNQPFFAMEMVRGEPLNRYCDQRRLSIEQRLRLFNDVCSGVQHAHQKGIIHRDLKPGNILVTEVDGKPVPKVIDFGLAKAMETSERLTDKSLFTGIGQILGTLKYMSPEQAGMETHDIDIRTDVYALGVVLYELLTGSTPLDEKSLKGQAILSVLATIREQEPAKPSSRLSQSDRTAASITDARRTDTSSLHRILVGDLDWVVMKALEKDRSRRYDSVSSFVADIRRYLGSEPVLARPPSLNYRVRKFVKKNFAGVLASSLVLLALIVGIIGTTWALIIANRARAAETIERRRADQRTEGERLAKLDSQEQSRKALEEKQIAQAVKDFLQNRLLGQADIRLQANDLLEAGQLASDAKSNVTIGELVDRAAVELSSDRIESRFPNQPILQTEVLQTIGNAYLSMGRYVEAISHLERARSLCTASRGADDPGTLNVSHDLSYAFLAGGQYTEAIELLERIHTLRNERLGEAHWDTLATLSLLAVVYRVVGKQARALELFQQARHIREQTLDSDPIAALATLANLARTHREIGEYALALAILEQVHKSQIERLGAQHPDTMSTSRELAMVYNTVGRYSDAIDILEPLYRTHVAKQGISHPSTYNILSSLAIAYSTASRHSEAIKLLEEACLLIAEKLGETHPSALSARVNLGSVYRAAGRYAEAIELLESLYPIALENLGIEHFHTMSLISNLASTYRNFGRAPDAVEFLNNVLPLMEEKLGAEHATTRNTKAGLAVAHRDAGRVDEAIELLEEIFAVMREAPGLDHPNTLTVVGQLAITYRVSGNSEKASEMIELAGVGLEKLQFQVQSSVWIVNEAINSYEIANQFDRAEVWLRKWLIVIGNKYGENSTTYATLLARNGRNMLLQNKFDEAAEILNRSLAILALEEPDVWTTYNTQSLLGGSLLGQAQNKSKADDAASRTQATGLYREAEKCLLDGYEGLKKHAALIPSHSQNCPRDAVDRLINLYKTLDRPTELNRWQDERKNW
ncbi:MAG TPA: serine/threonine-protein kinase [Pirellulaceae bacterium]|nr:serine/threonine-protein kinase [Pirellulaceae bacterium]HMP71398.1 serine/threonine-protein kinase [Pirellulaceae bacterium]